MTIQHAFDDADAYDERGILKDGHSVRVHLTMMDGNRPKPLAFNISDGDDTRDARRQERQARQAARRAGTADGTVDVAPITLAKLATDAVLQRGGAVDAFDAYSANKPGYRFEDRSASDAAREERMLFDSRAWMTPDADKSGLSTSTGASTRAVPQMPLGAYPLSAGEGGQCTINGSKGHLIKEGDFLICRPDAADALVGDRAAVDAAWRTMVAEQSETWRKQG